MKLPLFLSIHFLKKASLALLCIVYIAAGINHFLHPQGYWDLIPPYFPYHSLLNIIAGVAEIIAAILMMFIITRKFAAFLLIVILAAFIPAHIYLIQMKGCVSKSMCIPEWLAWVRLFPFQFILMWWAWKSYKWNT